MDAHLERLLQGADFLFPNKEWKTKKNECNLFLKKEFLPQHSFRLEISGGHLFFSKKMHAPKKDFLSATEAQSKKAPSLIPAYVKNRNYLLADLELKMAMEKRFEDVLFFDLAGNLTEASTSNVFIVKNDLSISTPNISSMVLAGVTREKIINYLKLAGFDFRERDILKSELEDAKEIWLTNSVQGIRFINCYKEKTIEIKNSLYQKICSQFGRFGEKYNE